MKKILVPTDFSDIAEYALEYAAFFAKRTEGTLYIITVIKSKDEKAKRLAQEKLDDLKNKKILTNINVETTITVGEGIRSSIVKAAENYNVDLIIMGSNGASLFGEIMLGSNTEKVIRKSTYSVLTIKHQMISLKLSSIVFASDFTNIKNKAFKTVFN